MTQVILITEQEFKDICPVSANTSAGTIIKKILDAQEQYLKPTLGCDLYNEIIAQKITPPMSVNNIELLTYYKPALAWWTLYLYLPWNWASIREQGAVTKAGEYAQTISLNDLTYLRGEALSSATNYRIILQQYLCTNSSLFPLYKHCGCCSANSSTTSTNIFFTV